MHSSGIWQCQQLHCCGPGQQSPTAAGTPTESTHRQAAVPVMTNIQKHWAYNLSSNPLNCLLGDHWVTGLSAHMGRAAKGKLWVLRYQTTFMPEDCRLTSEHWSPDSTGRTKPTETQAAKTMLPINLEAATTFSHLPQLWGAAASPAPPGLSNPPIAEANPSLERSRGRSGHTSAPLVC